MVKILSQAGRSLADMYDVVGSIAGIELLETRALPIMHEMGATIFSERFRSTFRRLTSGAVAQNTDIDLEIDNMPEGISRIIGVQVFADDGARIANAAVAIFEPVADQAFPIWVWEVGNTAPFRIRDNGATATRDLLVPERGLTLPSFTTSGQAHREMREFHVRARTSGFGAGTVELIALVHFAFTFTGGVSAFGARIPSW